MLNPRYQGEHPCEFMNGMIKIGQAEIETHEVCSVQVELLPPCGISICVHMLAEFNFMVVPMDRHTQLGWIK